MRNDERIPNLASKLKLNSLQLLFAKKKTVKNVVNWLFHQLFTVIWPKTVKCFSMRILRPDFEFSHHFAYLWTPSDTIFTFWFLTSLVII